MKIEDNAFYILDVSPNDNKRQILEQAEEKCLFEDQEKIENAKNQLLDTKKRLAMELAWFPGVSDSEVENIKSLLGGSAADTVLGRINNYGRLNFELAVMTGRSYDKLKNKTALGAKINELAKLYESHAIDFLDGFHNLLNDINTSRNISGFPQIRQEDLAEALDSRRTQIINMLKDKLDQLPPDYLLETVKYIAMEGTGNGTYRASIFIEEILARYELEIQHFVETEFGQIRDAIDNAEKLAKQRKEQDTLARAIDKICKYMKTWHQVVVPLQIISLSKGKEHEQSEDLLYGIRNLAVEFNNAAGAPNLSKKLLVDMEKLQVYEYMPEMQKLKEDDLKEIEKLLSSQKRQPATRSNGNISNVAQGTGKILYQDKWGLIFTHHITLTDQEIIYDASTRIRLDDIVAVSWGAVSRSVNNIPVGTTYDITFYTEKNALEITPNKRVLKKLVDSIWQPICVRLMVDMLMDLRKGKEIRIGDILVNDQGAYLKKSGWFSAGDVAYYPWRAVKTYSSNGYFYVSTRDGKYEAYSSYMNNRNTHILDAILNQFLKNYNASKPWLSTLLK